VVFLNTSQVNAYDQGRIKSLRVPRPVFSAGPQSTEKCGGVSCDLDALLFM
jgi:hypothetical protein